MTIIRKGSVRKNTKNRKARFKKVKKTTCKGGGSRKKSTRKQSHLVPSVCRDCDVYTKNIEQLRPYNNVKQLELVKGFYNACQTCSSMCADSLSLKSEHQDPVYKKELLQCKKYRVAAQVANNNYDKLSLAAWLDSTRKGAPIVRDPFPALKKR